MATTTALFGTGGVNLRSTSTKRKQDCRVRCALLPQERPQESISSSRRFVSISLVLLHCPSIPKHVIAGSALDKYLKKKKLDPLGAYVPAIILTEFQIQELGKSLEDNEPRYADCRSLLRSGPASSLRVNIRAVAQYASEIGNGKTAFNKVDQCLTALEDLDSLLLHASRKDPDASIDSMKVKISIALDALDSLLGTVPTDVLEQGKAVVEAYRAPAEDVAPPPPQVFDLELKQLESIL